MLERYTRPEMGKIWSLKNKYNAWLKVEIAATNAWAELLHGSISYYLQSLRDLARLNNTIGSGANSVRDDHLTSY